MNSIDLTVESSTSDIFEYETNLTVNACDIIVGEFYNQNTLLVGTVEDITGNPLDQRIGVDLFLKDVFNYQEEAFDMQRLLNGADLQGGVSPNPSFPNVVSLSLEEPLSSLQMYTNTLQVLAAPAELCVKKALELISSRANYDVAIKAFHMELLEQFVTEAGELEINALVKGVKCIADYLLAYFKNADRSNSDLFAYEFYDLHLGHYLFMTKIVLDANLQPVLSPTAVAKPAYTYPEVQAKTRQAYSTPTHQLVYF
jgi:hypothetical protein